MHYGDKPSTKDKNYILIAGYTVFAGAGLTLPALAQATSYLVIL